MYKHRSLPPELRVSHNNQVGANGVRQRQIRELREQFQKVSASFNSLLDRLGEDLVMRRPDSQSWSVADCIAHLTTTSEAFFPVWKEQVEASRPPVESSDELRLGLLARLIIRMMEPPVRFRISTPQGFVPAASGSARQILEAFLGSQTELIKILHLTADLPADRLKIASPFSSRLRYTLWSSFHIVAAHQRRHLWQAEQAVRRLESRADQQTRAAQP